MIEILTVAGLVVLTQLVKKFIYPKFGAFGVQVFVFLLAFAIISVKGLMTIYPSFGEMVLTAGKYLVESLALYEIVYKRLNEKLNLGL